MATITPTEPHVRRAAPPRVARLDDRSKRLAVTLGLGAALAAGACREFIQRDDLQPLPVRGHNYAFRQEHYFVERLFNGFDYGHATAYEALTTGGRDLARLEGPLFDSIMRVNDDPPDLQPAEEAIAPNFTRAYWPVMNVFDWSHGLHRDINDILADDDVDDKHAAIEAATDRYLRHKHALHWRWKRMDILMDGQPYSKEFRARYPKWNGIIWAYHWLQNGIYEPLVLGRTPSERAVGADAAGALFQCSRFDPPSRFPPHMPMSWEAAPTFARMHPRAAAVFDNLHMLHDIVADVLVSNKVRDKQAELDRMIALLQDDRSFIDDSGNRGMGPNMGHEMGPGTAPSSHEPAPTPSASPPPHGAHGARQPAGPPVLGCAPGRLTGPLVAHEGHAHPKPGAAPSAGAPSSAPPAGGAAPASPTGHEGHGAMNDQAGTSAMSTAGPRGPVGPGAPCAEGLRRTPPAFVRGGG